MDSYFVSQSPSNEEDRMSLIKLQPTMPISEVFKNIIKKYEENKPHSISILKISKDYGVQHRRIYDFFNFLTAIGICNGRERKKLSWCGMSNALPYFIDSYTNLEISSGNSSMTSLFLLGPSPSLGKIATKFVCLYFYLGVQTISIRCASALFKDDLTDIKSLERRMYLVLSFLEIIGIITHTQKRCKYAINVNAKEITDKAILKKLEIMGKNDPLSIGALLNEAPAGYVASLLNQRRHKFQSFFTKN